ncbi:MAG: hypothetical protein ACJA0U_000459 [Salibacteraceae bacterium]
MEQPISEKKNDVKTGKKNRIIRRFVFQTKEGYENLSLSLNGVEITKEMPILWYYTD